MNECTVAAAQCVIVGIWVGGGITGVIAPQIAQMQQYMTSVNHCGQLRCLCIRQSFANRCISNTMYIPLNRLIDDVVTIVALLVGIQVVDRWCAPLVPPSPIPCADIHHYSLPLRPHTITSVQL